jgi:PAS domain S-box-containing protein
MSSLEPGRETIASSHYEAIVQSSEDAILSKDRHAIITSWNPAAERLYGYTADEAVGSPVSMLIPPDLSGEEQRILQAVLRGEKVDHSETERVTKDGRIVTVSLTASPVRGEDGEIAGASVIARDVSDRRRAEERGERLQRITFELARELHPERTLEVLLKNALPALGADAGAVGLVDADGTHVEIAGSAGYTEERIGVWRRLPVDAALPLPDVVRTAEPLWIADGDELIRRYPALAEVRTQFESLAVVPLLVSDRAFGGVVLSFREHHEFPPEERAFVLAAAQQAAHALDRSRLFESEQRRRHQLAFVAQASEILAESLDVDATLQRLAAVAVPAIGDWCSIDLVGEDGEIRNVAVAHVDPERLALADEFRRRYPPSADDETGSANVIRTGEPELYSEIPDELLENAAVDEEHLRMIRDLGMVSAMIVPLAARGQNLGAMTLVSAESGDHYSEDDLQMAQELARHAALAVDNATLYRREHEAAVTLQRALLPRRIPTPRGAQVAARYLPAGAGLEVGGDWFDLVESEDGQLDLVVGDVAGRGIQAAAVMGRLRTALRAYILDGHGPAAAVGRLDRLMGDFDELTMATLVHVKLDLATGHLEYLRAGHPPPLVRSPDGGVIELEGGSPPLGLKRGIAFEAHSVDLEPGSVLLLYTDGLIERRSEGIGPGLAQLREALASAPTDAETCATTVLDHLGGHELDDDVALVAVRFSGAEATEAPPG